MSNKTPAIEEEEEEEEEEEDTLPTAPWRYFSYL